MSVIKRMRNILSFTGVIILLTINAYGIEPEPRLGLGDVKVGGEIGRRIDITIQNNLLKINTEKDFIKPFQEKKAGDGFVGLGMFIDSLVRFTAYTHEEQLIRLKDQVIREAIATQEPDGYLGMLEPGKRMWKLWDIHEMVYIVNGLVSDYHFFGKQESLQSAKKLMDYIIRRWREKPDGLNDIDTTVFMAVTGLEEALLKLYDETKDSSYLDFCVHFRQLPEWDYPIDIGRWGKIGGHAFAYMHRCLAQLRLYQLQPDDQLLRQAEGVIQFLTEKDGLLINGVCSQHECWHDNQDGTEGLGETCATAYLIRMLDELIRMKHDSLYGDLMERAIFNGLFAAQSPDGRKLRYYVPFEGERVFFDLDTYCCPNNYRRILSELPSMIYYKMDGGIAVNLYTASDASISLDNNEKVRIQQKTEYPNSGIIQIKIEPSAPSKFPVYLRIPRWCESGVITINDEDTVFATQSGRFQRIERTWKSGDQINLNLSIKSRFIKGRKAQSGRLAVMRGPQVFCLNPERNPETVKVDINQIVIDPKTIEAPVSDTTVRPDGLALKVKGWKKLGFSTGVNHDLQLLLTEFPDPNGRATYFKDRNYGQNSLEDELVIKR